MHTHIHSYNKLVLAQHLDDCAESLFMSLMHNGQVGTHIHTQMEKGG